MRTNQGHVTHRSRATSVFWELVAGAAMIAPPFYFGRLESELLAFLGCIGSFLLLLEVLVFRLDVWNVGLTHRQAVDRLLRRR
jgi:hypothetical protein